MSTPEPSSMPALRALPIPEPPAGALTSAIDTFLSQQDMTGNTRRAYATTLRVIERAAAGEPLDAPLLAAIVTRRWDDASAATWNLRTAAVRSFVAYVREQDLIDVPDELLLRR